MADSNGNGQKQGPASGIDQAALNRSIIERPEASVAATPTINNNVLWFATQVADEITPWGRNYKLRDKQLRDFITKESIFASALGIICARNGGFSWELEGPEAPTKRLQYVLETANAGEGWIDLVVKVSIDLYTQDSGAFIEVVREQDNPASPVIALNHLDAARCWHTGDPENPVVYLDRKNKYHLLKWFNVVTISEMPAAVEGLYGVQYCALTRMLASVQVLRHITQYKYEKTSGRNPNAVFLLSGIGAKTVQDVIEQARGLADAAGLTRYMPAVLASGHDPETPVSVATLELASLPDGYDEEVTFKQYIAQIAMAFQTDYQEFAPLPGGGLGTSAQSQVLHLKTRGKGPAMFMGLLGQAINFRVLPKNIEFRWDEQDIEADEAEATVAKLRAEERAARITSGELTVDVARQRAQDAGDLTLEQLESMGSEDASPDVTVENETQPDAQLGEPGTVTPQGEQPATPGPAQPGGAPTAPPPAAVRQKAEEPVPDERAEVEDDVAKAVERGFAQIRERLRKRLEADE